MIFIGPHICDLGPKSCPQDRLSEETVSLLDDCLSNYALDSNVRYISMRQILSRKIQEMQMNFPDNPHFAVFSGIHLTLEGANVIATEVAKQILSIIMSKKYFL